MIFETSVGDGGGTGLQVSVDIYWAHDSRYRFGLHIIIEHHFSTQLQVLDK